MNINTPATDNALTTIEKRLTSTMGGGLLDAIKARRSSALLVDCSGSMGGRITTGQRKIDVLRDVVRDLRDENPVPLVAFGLRLGFHSDPDVKLVDDVPDPAGDTPVHLAIDFAAANGAGHAVLVTDGIADSMSMAYESARRFGGVIDVFYIGNGGDRGAAFAQELARMTGGTCNLTDLKDQKQLKSAIKGLLPAPQALLMDGGAL
jgi:hypothetical protein